MSYMVTSLSPVHCDTIQDFFTKFKSLVFHLKQCGIEKKEDQLILSILSNLGPDFSIFVSTFHSGKLTLWNRKIPSLEKFMESLTHKQEKLVQMCTIKTKYQALAVGVSNSSKGKSKSKNLKLPEKKKNLNPMVQVRIFPRRRTRMEKRSPNEPISIMYGI